MPFSEKEGLGALPSDSGAARVTDRQVRGALVRLKLSNGSEFSARRYFPAGVGDIVLVDGSSQKVWVKNDRVWIEVGTGWSQISSAAALGASAELTVKEIETEEELAHYEKLRGFHYRGGGGAGRTIPLVATSAAWDLPPVLGFIEISSSMIANTARKRFFDIPYRESDFIRWNQWDRYATKTFSNIICRISRFVIHPELRGLGVAKYLLRASREYALDRWHYGGYRARFIEITADMLRYYRFLDSSFEFMGLTEGNQHRLQKDMQYLVRKATSSQGAKGMPQGGGGIMTLQRGYASQLMRFSSDEDRSVPEVIESLRHDPSRLDQRTWEALHRLNRKPKPCFIAGVTPYAADYVRTKRSTAPVAQKKATSINSGAIHLRGLSASKRAPISQSSESRSLQDAFGFVGADVSVELFADLSFDLQRGDVTLVCGASGAGKSMLLESVSDALTAGGRKDGAAPRIAQLKPLPLDKAPIELRGRASLEDFLDITARCGLAEPQLLVRSAHGLSSGQRYRLQIALAFLRKPDVLVIDNFCEPLDRYTSTAVMKGVHGLAVERGVAVLAATAAYERLLAIRRPNQLILLRRGSDPLILRGASQIQHAQEGLLSHPLPHSDAEQLHRRQQK